jgi:hypothetical protein
MKLCNECNIEKPYEDFNKDSWKKDGFRNSCRLCAKKKYLENRDKEILRVKTYQKNNREKVLKQKLIHAKEYFLKNREKIKEYQRQHKAERRKNDVLFRLSCNLSSRVRQFISKRKMRKTNTTFEIVGCTPQELKTYLEQKFTEGMSWENQGKWHIDHKIPLASAKSEEELYKLCHFTNLQPMWASENIKKGSKII